MLELDAAPSIGTQARLDGGAGTAAPVLGLQSQRAAQGVEAKQWVRAGHQGQRFDGHARDQVPADDVAKRLVQSHAVEIHRESLRRAQQGRSRIAAIADVGLERVVLHFIHDNAAQVAAQEGGNVECAAERDLLRAGRLHGRGKRVARLLHGGQRHAARDDNGGQVARGGQAGVNGKVGGLRLAQRHGGGGE